MLQKNELTNQLDVLIAAFRAIPRLRDTSVQFWMTLFEDHWQPALRQLNAICGECGRLYPQQDVRDSTSYYSLTAIINQELGLETFERRICALVNSFSILNQIHFAAIPDDLIAKKLSRVVYSLALAVERFDADIQHAHELALHPQHMAPT